MSEGFQPPPERSLADLVRSIRARIDCGQFEPELLADLRFFAFVRLEQKFSREEVSAEITSWGWDEREAYGLVASCIARNRRDEAIRRRARSLAEAEGLQQHPELAFDPVDLSQPPTRTFRDVSYAKLIFFLLLAFLTLFLTVCYFQ